MKIEVAQIEITFFVEMPDDPVEQDDRADAISDEMVRLVETPALYSLGVAEGSVSISNWTSRSAKEEA